MSLWEFFRLVSQSTTFDLCRFRHHQRWECSALSLLVFVCVLSLNVRPAEATCGDYLSHHQLLSPLSPVSQHAPVVPLCHGPACHKPPVSLPEPTRTVSFEFRDQGICAGHVPFVATHSTGLVIDRTLPLVTEAIRSRLERPPKANAI